MIKNTFIFTLFLSLIFSPVLAGLDEKQSSPEWRKHYRQDYDFTLDGTFYSFMNNIPTWERILHPFKGKPDIHYLEIGVNQGRSAMWVLENILSGSSSTLTGIDIFPEGTDFKKKYLSNLKLSGFAHKATTIEGFSQIELRKLPLNFFDVIYIDGDHRADGVMADAVLSFALLKTGGILIFDDYLWFDEHLPEELRPKVAIDSFITAYRNSIEVVHRGYQLFIQKREGSCEQFTDFPAGCTPIGQYIYVWNWNWENALYPQGKNVPITLSDREKHLLEGLIRSTKFGSTKMFLDSTTAQDKDFINLSERLKLDFTNIEVEQAKGFLDAVKDRLCTSSQD